MIKGILESYEEILINPDVAKLMFEKAHEESPEAVSSCPWCRKIEQDGKQCSVEEFVAHHLSLEIIQASCKECFQTTVKEMLKRINGDPKRPKN